MSKSLSSSGGGFSKLRSSMPGKEFTRSSSSSARGMSSFGGSVVKAGLWLAVCRL